MNKNYKEERPWGSFEHLLDEPYCKVKRIIVKPDQRLSEQFHHKRDEHWVVVEGEGLVITSSFARSCKMGDSVFIPRLMKHRVKNTGLKNLIFIEVQTGEYFGEDDIVRSADDYGRE